MSLIKDAVILQMKGGEIMYFENLMNGLVGPIVVALTFFMVFLILRWLEKAGDEDAIGQFKQGHTYVEYLPPWAKSRKLLWFKVLEAGKITNQGRRELGIKIEVNGEVNFWSAEWIRIMNLSYMEENEFREKLESSDSKYSCVCGNKTYFLKKVNVTVDQMIGPNLSGCDSILLDSCDEIESIGGSVRCMYCESITTEKI